MKRSLALILAVLSLLAMSPAQAIECPPNWYEVFVRAYQDSNGDGMGDLNGLANRLDYIQDMGWGGLWLMPIMPSPSYHKYDVTDYCAVDAEYGTIEDFRTLTDACHARGMRVIVDLPVNHTSTQHPWFVRACAALRAGHADDPAVAWYNFSTEPKDGYVPLKGTEWYYEERFTGGGMPDLNLDDPEVQAEIEAIFRFWLVDMDADGFRLDAVTSYYTRETGKNVGRLRWMKALAESIKPDSILIGECWANLVTIAEYYDSGVDSFFLFPAAQTEGFIAKSIMARKDQGEKFAKAYQSVLEAIPDGWLTPFVSNHDTGRALGLVQGRGSSDRAKLAQGVLGMLNGSTFTYYGDEIGMVGSGDDPNKRLAMYWDDGDMAVQPSGATTVEYPYPSVKEQLADPKSILNYVKAVNRARLDFPAISQGANSFLLTEGSVCVMRRDHASGDVAIAINFSSKDAATVVLDGLERAEIAVDLETGDGVAVLKRQAESTALTLPPCAIAVIKL